MFNSEIFENKNVKRGLRQGCVLSKVDMVDNEKKSTNLVTWN